MAETFKGSEGRRVIAADSAENIGDIKAFVVDPTATRIQSIHITGRGRRAEVVPWTRVESFGADAVIVDTASSVEQVTSDREVQAVKGKIDIIGARVLAVDGNEAGTVSDVMFEMETGELTGALTTEGHISASGFQSIGSYALVVDHPSSPR